MAEGLNAVIVSPSVILGKWKWSHGSGKFFSRVWKGLNFYSDGVTGFVDVSDCVSCMAALMKSEISGERFILSSENISYRELVSQIAELFGKRKPNRKAGRWLLHSAVLAEGFRSWLLNREPLINPETARFGLEKFYYSNEKICAALNYRFKPVAETIRETALSFLSENRK
jgi:nucleoside-diphosphate-sugar epimerase